MNALRAAAVPIAAMLGFLALWEVIFWTHGRPNYKMASPSDLPPAFRKFRWFFFEMSWRTLRRKLAWLGVALIFIGPHDFSTVLMAFLIPFFPIAVSVGIGRSTLEPECRDILRSLGAGRATIFRKIALPKSLPVFFGARVKSGETIGDHPLMPAVLIALAALGIVLHHAVVVLARILAGWAERPAQ